LINFKKVLLGLFSKVTWQTVSRLKVFLKKKKFKKSCDNYDLIRKQREINVIGRIIKMNKNKTRNQGD
jgi:hypothetical protein